MSRDVRQLAELEQLGQDVARRLGRAVEGAAAEAGVEVCFAVLLFTPGDDGWATYVSNAARADMVKALRELIGRIETGRTTADPGTGGRLPS